MIKLSRYSMGIGDRFGRQGTAQLDAIKKALSKGVEISPVWNKSNREHVIIGTKPADARAAADKAVKRAGWKKPYFLDADHIGLGNVDGFLASCDFFTIDVAEDIGKPAPEDAVRAFVKEQEGLVGSLDVPGIKGGLSITRPQVEAAAKKFLQAVRLAGEIYRRIEAANGRGKFVTELSFDESDIPQSPLEILLILAAVAAQGIPADTLAPRFSGRFNKGVDYVGDPKKFGREFSDDIAVLRFAAEKFSLPRDLKLSVHSGSDKFAIYGEMRRALESNGAGVHLKTAGTTWLEELIGLAQAGGEGLKIAKDVYKEAWARREELCKPYATVIDLKASGLPEPSDVAKWDGNAFASALRHDESCKAYNPNLRQLLHVGYKVAAEMGGRYLDALSSKETVVGACVSENLYERHIRRIFPGL